MQNCTRLVHALVSLKFRVEFLEADELLLDGTTPRRRFRVNCDKKEIMVHSM